MTQTTAITVKSGPSGTAITTTTRALFGSHLAALTSRQGVDRHTALIPAGEAQEILARVDEALSRRPTGAEAAALAAKLIGCYPSQERGGRPAYNDPKLFMAELAELLGEYPPSIGAGAVNQMLRERKYPPAIAEVCTALKAARGMWEGYRWRARKHLAEHEARAKDAEIDRNRIDPAAVEAVMSKFRARVINKGGTDISENGNKKKYQNRK